MGDNDNISKNAINGCRTVVLLVGLDWVSLGGVRYRVVAQLDDLCKDHWLFVLIISLSILSTANLSPQMGSQLDGYENKCETNMTEI